MSWVLKGLRCLVAPCDLLPRACSLKPYESAGILVGEVEVSKLLETVLLKERLFEFGGVMSLAAEGILAAAGDRDESVENTVASRIE